MTVAVWVKVYDGIALATDSATTLPIPGRTQVYNNADKIFHLHRGLPIGAMTWGLGQIGPASISTVSKSLRLRLMGRDPAYRSWELTDRYTIEEVAQRVAEMFCDSLIQSGITDWPGRLGYLITGYSSGCDQPEAWLLEFEGSATSPPVTKEVAPTGRYGFEAYAQPEAIERLFNGYDQQLKADLLRNTDPANHADVEALLATHHEVPISVAMPLPDAIALAKFMVETTSGYRHFNLGPDTVGGPVEVAGISLHEGFKWIARKHYFSTDLNKGELDDQQLRQPPPPPPDVQRPLRRRPATATPRRIAGRRNV
ncbi:hypothetical protein [Mycolicibacterium sp. D5.8-2]|uniref:hypothetical protein n=1 Tax=Mycolicibacterium sp. D5.8-2 TaxID=3085903 RepID=UPI00298D4A2D|nr:hypothetical protein [Mycolicibacterium sp. D5.8-2]MDW5609257.1 hypothetical protein [Mycolicibacterium sp. D5.8-2]